MKKPAYQKISRRILSWYGPSSLWKGEDHFLHSRGFFIEEYRRLHFEDIEGVVIEPSVQGWVQGWTFTAMLLFFGICYAPLGYTDFFFPFFPMGLMVLLLLIHLVRGPTCRFRMITAENDVVMRSITRVRYAKRIRAQLVELLQENQGTFDPEAVPPGFPREGAPTRPIRKLQPIFHLLTLISIFIMGLCSGVMLINEATRMDGWIPRLALGMLVISLLAGIGGLVLQARSNATPGLRAWTWLVFAHFMVYLNMAFILSIAAYTALIGVLVRNTGPMTNPDELNNELVFMMENLMSQMSWLNVLFAFALACCTILSLSGLVAFLRFSRRPDAYCQASPAAREEGANA